MRINHEPWTYFKGIEKKEKPSWNDPDEWVECPKCKGYTLCIEGENAYGEGRHFRLSCNNCGGMNPLGWVKKGEECLHEWKETKIGNCLYVKTCKICGNKQTIDSSG